MYGYPPFFPPNVGRTGLTIEDIKEAEKSLSELKKSLKEDVDKEKNKRSATPKFDILQITGILMLLSVPVVLLQLHLLEIAKQTLKATLQ